MNEKINEELMNARRENDARGSRRYLSSFVIIRESF